MINQDAFEQPGAPARIFGGMSRLANSSADRVDRDFARAGDAPAAFAISRRLNAGEAGRLMVSAGCLSPDDPRVIAMQEAPDQARVEAMKAPGGLRMASQETVEALTACDMGREGRSALAGIRRSFKNIESGQGPSFGSVAEAFGRIALAASSESEKPARDIAAKAFATTAQAGVEAARERDLSRSKDTQER
jgi:hypothetical protein